MKFVGQNTNIHPQRARYRPGYNAYVTQFSKHFVPSLCTYGVVNFIRIQLFSQGFLCFISYSEV